MLLAGRKKQQKNLEIPQKHWGNKNEKKENSDCLNNNKRESNAVQDHNH